MTSSIERRLPVDLSDRRSRRWFLGRLGVLSVAALGVPTLLASCGGADDDEPDSEATTQPSGTATETSEGTGEDTASPDTSNEPGDRKESRGELRVAEPFLTAVLDSDVGTTGNILQAMGVCECLMRYTQELDVEPWIAASLEAVDSLTWEITLREDVTFWDGSPVDAEAVKASLERTMELQPGTADLLPPESTLTADGWTLTIATPEPIALLAYHLATPSFAIKKVVSEEEFLYTGPFTIESFMPRESLDLVAYPDYRGGPPRLEAIRARQVPDVATRSLALQSGEVEIAQALLPSDAGRLQSDEITMLTAPWARQHMVMLNLATPPLDDVDVRRAFALAIDRQALVDGIMDGVGMPAYGVAPEDISLPGIVQTQAYDPDQAQRLLDAAGWVVADSDGIRERDGSKLAFKLGIYPGRAELEQFAIVMIDMLKAVGIEVEIEQFDDVEQALATGAYEATTYSLGSGAFGDISQLLGTLYIPSTRQTTYDNPEVTERYQQYLVTESSEERAVLFTEMQEIIGQDVPIIHLVNPYQIVGVASGVRNFTPHPLDSYKYNAETALDD